MAATAGQMNVNRTAAVDLAAALLTGEMIAREETTAGLMEVSEPATVTGLMAFQTHATDGLMLVKGNS